ncbi:hypothetical protein RRG08_032466 [Elysia crispata]|uniref:Uncharacterized protein n=1 Tax=Elysia crispata TaxID=231223 RepID=A0AAE1E1M8_9GAST|nr:hypothetical protein RRG08_032466 [Elysia crispata]
MLEGDERAQHVSDNKHPSPSDQVSDNKHPSPSDQVSDNKHPSPSDQVSHNKHPSPSDQVSDNKHPSPSEHRTPRTTMKLFVTICLTLVIIAVGEVSGCIQNNCHGKYVWSAHGVQYCCELPTYPSIKRVAYYRWYGTHTKIECRCLSVTAWCNLHKHCS